MVFRRYSDAQGRKLNRFLFEFKFEFLNLIFSSSSSAKYQVFRVQADKITKSTYQLNRSRFVYMLFF